MANYSYVIPIDPSKLPDGNDNTLAGEGPGNIVIQLMPTSIPNGCAYPCPPTPFPPITGMTPFPCMPAMTTSYPSMSAMSMPLPSMGCYSCSIPIPQHSQCSMQYKPDTNQPPSVSYQVQYVFNRDGEAAELSSRAATAKKSFSDVRVRSSSGKSTEFPEPDSFKRDTLASNPSQDYVNQLCDYVRHAVETAATEASKAAVKQIEYKFRSVGSNHTNNSLLSMEPAKTPAQHSKEQSRHNPSVMPHTIVLTKSLSGYRVAKPKTNLRAKIRTQSIQTDRIDHSKQSQFIYLPESQSPSKTKYPTSRSTQANYQPTPKKDPLINVDSITTPLAHIFVSATDLSESSTTTEKVPCVENYCKQETRCNQDKKDCAHRSASNSRCTWCNRHNCTCYFAGDPYPNIKNAKCCP